jgi:hypothetical protein
MMMIECLPQELLIIVLSYLPINNIHTCSFLNTQWYTMIHDDDSSCSQQIWKTLCQLHLGEDRNILSNRNQTWKQLYQFTTELKFIPSLSTQVVLENGNRSVFTKDKDWQTFKTNKCIVLSECSDRSEKYCFDVVLDEFNPEYSTRNYYSVVIGVYWNINASEVKMIENNYPPAIIGGHKQEIGFRCGNRTILYCGTNYYCKGSNGDHTFPDKHNTLKSGDIIHVELILNKSSFDINYYLNGVKMNEKQYPSEAYSIVPYVSAIHHNKFTIQRSLPLQE